VLLIAANSLEEFFVNRQPIFRFDDENNVDDESRVLPKLRIDTILPLPPIVVYAIMVVVLE